MTKRRPWWFKLPAALAAFYCSVASAMPPEGMPPLDLPMSAVWEGRASYYGGRLDGRKTASGERFDRHLPTAASNHFPLGTRLAVRRVDTGDCAVVRVNDRMRPHPTRIIDVSKSIGELLGMLRAGIVRVQLAVLPASSTDDHEEGCAGAFPTPQSRSAGPQTDDGGTSH